jgi:hypothetical protein
MNAIYIIAILFAMTVFCPSTTFGYSAPTEGPDDKLSRAYSKAAFSALADIHRWKEKVRSDAKGFVSNPTFGKRLKTVAYESLRISQMTSENDADHRAGELLQRLFDNVATWSTRMADARANLDATYSIDPNKVDEDAELVRIGDCEKGVSSMLTSGTFHEVAACR